MNPEVSLFHYFQDDILDKHNQQLLYIYSRSV